MQAIIKLTNHFQDLLEHTNKIDFLAPLAFRLYLAPIFIGAGLHKYHNFSDIVAWFEFGLELPAPQLMAFSATAIEILGGFALLVGFATRWISIPLMLTMIVAIFTAHWDNGWFAIAPSNPETSTAYVLDIAKIPGAAESLSNSEEVGKRLSAAKNILKEHGNYQWLKAKGSFVILNNGIEFAATYFIMLLMLLRTGAGSFLSLDYWIRKQFRTQT